MTREILKKYDDFVIYEDRLEHGVSACLAKDDKSNPLFSVTVDVMDSTIAGVITEQQLQDIANLGIDKNKAIADFFKVLLSHYGTKQFVMLPNSAETPEGFTPAQDHGFKRVMFVNKKALTTQSNEVAKAKLKCQTTLDDNFALAVGVNKIFTGHDEHTRYNELVSFFANEAAYIEDKMQEFKDEDRLGMQSRLNHENVTVFALQQESDEKIVATIRALDIGDGTAYLSDEIVDKNIIKPDDFNGTDDERHSYLLAYFMDKCMQSPEMQKFNHFVWIGANGREHHYNKLGCRPFAAKDCANKKDAHTIMSLSGMQLHLQNLKNAKLGIAQEKDEVAAPTHIAAPGK